MAVAVSNEVVHFKAYAHLLSVDATRNRYRFYTLTWHPSLFGGGAILRHWGRIGAEGMRRALFFESCEDAQKTLEWILKRRPSHGYSVVGWEYCVLLFIEDGCGIRHEDEAENVSRLS